MNWLVSILILAHPALAQSTNFVRHLTLDPFVVHQLPIAMDRLTTVRFPSPISNLEGAFVSVGDDPPALFQISFRNGSSFFSLRALVSDARVTVTIGWRNQTYVFECVESSEPVLSVILFEKPPESPPPPELPRRLKPALVTPAEVRDVMQTARLYPHLKIQHPALLADVERVTLNRTTDRLGFDTTVTEVFRFDAEDTLVLHVSMTNKTTGRILFLPSTIVVKAGNRRFTPSRVESDGVIPPCGEINIQIALSAGVNGTPSGLAPNNPFEIVLEQLATVPSRRCPHADPQTKPSKPRRILRSPKDAILHPNR